MKQIESMTDNIVKSHFVGLDTNAFFQTKATTASTIDLYKPASPQFSGP